MQKEYCARALPAPVAVEFMSISCAAWYGDFSAAKVTKVISRTSEARHIAPAILHLRGTRVNMGPKAVCVKLARALKIKPAKMLEGIP